MITDALNAVIEEAKAAISNWTEADLKAMPEKQYDVNDPRNLKDPARAKACFFTACHIYFQTVYKDFSQTWQQFREACIDNGAISIMFTVINRKRMAAAAGHPELVDSDFTDNLAQRINQLIDAGKPVPFSLNAEHYEIIVGRITYNGKQCFRVIDPGYWGDTMMDSTTLQVFHDQGGVQVFSKAHDGVTIRKCTHIYQWD